MSSTETKAHEDQLFFFGGGEAIRDKLAKFDFRVNLCFPGFFVDLVFTSDAGITYLRP